MRFTADDLGAGDIVATADGLAAYLSDTYADADNVAACLDAIRYA